MFIFVRRIRETLFWKSLYSEEFEKGMLMFSFFDCRELQEKKSYWKDNGNMHGLSPSEAAYRAFSEFSEDYYRKSRDNYDARKWLERMAGALAWAAPLYDKAGNVVDRRKLLGDKWNALLDGSMVKPK